MIYHQVSIVDPNNDPADVIGECPVRYRMMEQRHVFDANLQKELLLEYKQDSKNKSQEYAKFLANKKALITILFGQCYEATKTEIALRTTYLRSGPLSRKAFSFYCENVHCLFWR